jgi:hypothetical protein
MLLKYIAAIVRFGRVRRGGRCWSFGQNASDSKIKEEYN